MATVDNNNNYYYDYDYGDDYDYDDVDDDDDNNLRQTSSILRSTTTRIRTTRTGRPRISLWVCQPEEETRTWSRRLSLSALLGMTVSAWYSANGMHGIAMQQQSWLIQHHHQQHQTTTTTTAEDSVQSCLDFLLILYVACLLTALQLFLGSVLGKIAILAMKTLFTIQQQQQQKQQQGPYGCIFSLATRMTVRNVKSAWTTTTPTTNNRDSYSIFYYGQKMQSSSSSSSSTSSTFSSMLLHLRRQSLPMLSQSDWLHAIGSLATNCGFLWGGKHAALTVQSLKLLEPFETYLLKQFCFFSATKIHRNVVHANPKAQHSVTTATTPTTRGGGEWGILSSMLLTVGAALQLVWFPTFLTATAANPWIAAATTDNNNYNNNMDHLLSGNNRSGTTTTTTAAAAAAVASDKTFQFYLCVAFALLSGLALSSRNILLANGSGASANHKHHKTHSRSNPTKDTKTIIASPLTTQTLATNQVQEQVACLLNDKDIDKDGHEHWLQRQEEQQQQDKEHFLMKSLQNFTNLSFQSTLCLLILVILLELMALLCLVVVNVAAAAASSERRLPFFYSHASPLLHRVLLWLPDNYDTSGNSSDETGTSATAAASLGWWQWLSSLNLKILLFHPLYNAFSIVTLQVFCSNNALTHSLLNAGKRVCAIAMALLWSLSHNNDDDNDMHMHNPIHPSNAADLTITTTTTKRVTFATLARLVLLTVGALWYAMESSSGTWNSSNGSGNNQKTTLAATVSLPSDVDNFDFTARHSILEEEPQQLSNRHCRQHPQQHRRGDYSVRWQAWLQPACAVFLLTWPLMLETIS